jgi:hypothetical protein
MKPKNSLSAILLAASTATPAFSAVIDLTRDANTLKFGTQNYLGYPFGNFSDGTSATPATGTSYNSYIAGFARALYIPDFRVTYSSFSYQDEGGANRVNDFYINYGQAVNKISDTGAGTTATVGSLSGSGGMAMWRTGGLAGSFPGGVNFQLNGEKTGGALITTNPTITASTGAFNGNYTVSRIFDRQIDDGLNGDYAVNGQTAFIDMDFGATVPTIGFVDWADRATSDANTFTLTFSDTADFSSGNVVFNHTRVSGSEVSSVDVGSVTKRYLKFQITGGEGAAVGVSEMVFYAPVPEPSAPLIAGLGALGALSLRRRRAL